MALSKANRRLRLKKKIRKNVSGSESRPRLSVFRSNKGISAQLIDDVAGTTILQVVSKKLDASGNKTEVSKQVGKKIGEEAKAKGIESVVFDRNGYLYHGRVKALADGARESGLKF
ncbi:MAG: 50S ribosomal protein L18 [Cyclobacteriaceae bacterium]